MLSNSVRFISLLTVPVSGFRVVGLLLLTVFLASSAYAQQQGEVNPDVIRQSVDTMPRQQQTAPPIQLAERKPQGEIPGGSEEFTYKGMQIEGATVIPVESLQARWVHQMDAQVSVASIFAFADSVTNAYREAGYVLSFALVPEQTLSDGIFKITVVEAHIEGVDVKGADAPNKTNVKLREMLDVLTQERPLTSKTLERTLMLVNDLPGITARALLSPGIGGGSARLTVDIAYDPYRAMIDYRNHLPESLKRDLITASLEARGRLSGADVLRGSVSFSPDDNIYRSGSLFLGGSIGYKGDGYMSLAMSTTRTRPQTPSLQLLGYSGKSESATWQYSYPVVRSRARTVRLGYDAHINNFTSTTKVPAQEAARKEVVKTMTVWLEYDGIRSGGATTSMRWGVVQSLDSSSENEAPVGEGGGKQSVDNYSLVDFTLQSAIPLGKVGAKGGTMILQYSLNAQHTASSGKLISGARCYFGGQQFGRGYDSGTLGGDNCVKNSLVLNYRVSNTLSGRAAFWNAYMFIDMGEFRKKGTVILGEPRKENASSGGVGLSFTASRKVTARVEAAYPLDVPKSIQDDDVRLNGTLQLHF